MDELELLDWKRRVFLAYADVRAADDPSAAWRRWRDARAELFRGHPQSALAPEARAGFGGLPYFDYDPAYRVLGDVSAGDGELREVAASGGEVVRFRRFGVVRFELGGAEHELALFWLEAYGGGVFLPFADATSGLETYGGGRYLLDTVKGADLGEEDGRLVLDFNFAYNPSCSYDVRWVCPLSPPENRLPIPIRAGEMSARLPVRTRVRIRETNETRRDGLAGETGHALGMFRNGEVLVGLPGPGTQVVLPRSVLEVLGLDTFSVVDGLAEERARHSDLPASPRVRATEETEALGYAGLTGEVMGETKPSSSGVEVVGGGAEDYAIALYFEETGETAWFAPDLLE